MYYSEIINNVSNSTLRIFKEKNDGQRTHENIKSQKKAAGFSMQTKKTTKQLKQFQMDKLKYLL